MNSVDPVVHPWNAKQAETMARAVDQLPHALLLAGPPGLGKNRFAEWLSQMLLCEQLQPHGRVCGRCQSCRLVHAGSHADLHVVQPEAVYKNSDSLLARYALRYPPEDKSKEGKESRAIRIDQIRSLIEASQGRPHLARCRVLVLSPADDMNVNAANALLKLLEEPPPDSYFILVADRPMRLPATIRSRCVPIDFRPPDAEQAVAWLTGQGMAAAVATELLALTGGAPLEAADLAKSGFLEEREQLITELENLLAGKADAVACASLWKERGTDRCLRWLQGWLADLVHPGPKGLHNPGMVLRLQALQKRLHLNQLFVLAELVGQHRRRLGGTLDEQLLLEELLIRWTELQTITTS